MATRGKRGGQGKSRERGKQGKKQKEGMMDKEQEREKSMMEDYYK